MNKRFLAITLIFLLIIGFMPNVKAIALISTDTISEGIQDYDSYDITFDSNGSNYIKTNELRVADGKMKIVTTFSNASMITLNGVTLNGKKADYIIHEVTNNELTVETVINSLDDQINFDMQIKVPIINMVKNVDLYIKNIKLVDNTYDFDAETNGTKYIKSKSLKVENEEMTVITTFNMGSMIKVNSTTVNGEEVESVVNSGDMDTLIIETKINSLDDDISFNMTITVPGVMTSTKDLYLRDLRLPGVDIIDDSEDEDAPEDDSTEDGDNSEDNEDNGSVDDDSDNDVNNKVLEDGNYTIESDFIKTGTTNEESAAAGYIEKVSSLKVENGEYYLTLDIKEIGVLSNIGANIDGKETDVTVTESGDGKGKISFKINSLSSDILIKCRITVSQINFVMDTNFNVVLNKSTLKNENGEDIEGPDEDTDIPIYKNATYTIENTVSGIAPDSPIVGVISPKNTITVEDGKIYLTVTFYKSGFMDGRIITLNNNTTPARYSIEEDTSNKVTVKINIYSVNDKIKFSSKNSKSLDDGFTLLLLKDTLKEQISNDSTNNGGSSSDDDDDDNDDNDDLDDGTYVIKNKVLKENSDSESYARDYVDKESIITVKNGKIYLTLKFTHGKMMSDTSIKVEGKKTSYSTVKKSGNNYHIKFKIGALDDEILVTTTIDTGVSSIGKQEGVKFRVLLRESTLKEYDDDDNDDDDNDDDDEETGESNSSTGTTTGTVSGTVSGNTNNTVIIDDTLNNVVDLGIQSGSYKRETYSVTNDIVTDSTIGYQAARGAIETTSYMQVEQDKKYMIVNFGNTDGMSNIRLSMNGQNLAYEVLKEGNNQLSVRFETPDISTQVDVTATIPMLGRDISFGLKFNESTLTYIGTEEVGTSADSGSGSGSSAILNNILSTTTSTGGSTLAQGSSQGNAVSLSSDGSSNSESEGAGEEAVEAKEYYKKYTIENEVLSDSIMGRTMARKYLNTLSTIDDIDGQLYLTLTFSGSNAMDNFVFTVNGENREYSVVSDVDNELKAFKFKIDSVNDTIDVGIFIKPVKMNISFGVKLLEDTMVLIDEGEITSDGEFSEEDANEEFLAKSLSVQQKGSSNNELSVFKIAIVTSLMTTGMNAFLAGIIYLIIRRKKKKKLNKEAKTN